LAALSAGLEGLLHPYSRFDGWSWKPRPSRIC